MRIGGQLLAILASAMCVTACAGNDHSLPGKYETVGMAEKASLLINRNGTYRLCFPSRPCEISKYELEHWSNYGDRVFFFGKSMIKFTAGGWVDVDYGFRVDVRARLLLGRCPCFSFMDPDEGPQFEKVG
jgi:hypothetical protein